MRTQRQECLDHVIILNDRHLGQVLREFVDYYNQHARAGACTSKPHNPWPWSDMDQ